MLFFHGRLAFIEEKHFDKLGVCSTNLTGGVVCEIAAIERSQASERPERIAVYTRNLVVNRCHKSMNPKGTGNGTNAGCVPTRQ